MPLTRFSYIFILFVLFTTSHSQAQETYPENPDITAIQKQAKAAQKKMLLIGCTEWCGPCKTLKNEHFKDSAVKAILDKYFVIGSYDMEKGFGIMVSKKYAITSFPTLIVLDADGKMLHRIEGAFSEIGSLADALENAANLTESIYPGVSASFNLSFPAFYNERFENRTKKKVQQEVMNEYLKGQKDLSSEVNWRVMQVFEAGPVADAFIYNNYSKLKALYGPEPRLKINRIISKKLDENISSKDTVQFQQLVAYMRANKFTEKYIQDRQLTFYGKTGLNWPEYIKLLNAYLSDFDDGLTNFAKDVYAQKYPKEVGDAFLFWLNKKIEKESFSYYYVYKGLFLEAKQQQTEAEAMYQKAIEVASSSTKDMVGNSIKEMRSKL